MGDYKLVLIDLDGTLLNSSYKISNYTKDVLKKVNEKGVEIFISTGRHYKDALNIKKEIGLNEGFVISSNGGEIHDSNSNLIYSRLLDEDVVNHLIEKRVSSEIHRSLFTSKEWVVERYGTWLDYNKENEFQHTISNFNCYGDSKLIKFFYVSDNYPLIGQLKSELEETFGGRVNVVFSNLDCLEVMPKNVSKGSAIRNFIEDRDITLDEIIAFGDGLNDFEMLSSVGKGLIMGNGNEELKEKLPENEVIKSNDEDGVADYLEKLFLV